MVPVSNLDKAIISRVIPKKQVDKYDATIGILFIEPGNRDFFEYINYYNRASGTKIDFYIPGYRYDENNFSSLSEDVMSRNLADLAASYDPDLYRDAVEEIRLKLGLKVDKNQYPKLILTDVKIDYSVDKVLYGDRFMIDLEPYTDNFQPIFSKIFEYAENKVRIPSMRMRYIVGENVNKLVRLIRECVHEISIDFIEGKIIGM